MSEKQTLKWIADNLSEDINAALKEPYTLDWIAAMVYRETGFLISRYVKKGYKPEAIHSLMKGDYSKRAGEAKKQYHGYGYMQIDTGSYPEFIKSGAWKQPLALFVKAVSVLEEKRIYLQKSFPLMVGDQFYRAVTAAYNCGQGNVAKAIRQGLGVDHYTHQQNYSAEVWRLRGIFRAL